MIVVSDSSPLNILARIGHVNVLPKLFGTVLIPPAVHAELTHTATPLPVRNWLDNQPGWLRVQVPKAIDPTLDFDDPGECEAISLAMEIRADYLLADDRKARRAATARGIVVTGAVGVLEAAAAAGHLDLPTAFGKIQATDFSIAPAILQQALKRDAERRGL